MAAISESDHLSFQRMKTESVKQRRRELEEEVRKLQKMLTDEQKVHEILQRAQLPNCIPSTIHFPNFLPKEAKELLAELIVLEEEIARLEGEISKIQHSISSTEESRVQDSKRYNQYMHESTGLIASSNHPSTSPTQIPKSNLFEEKAAFERKPMFMFFINQAIKGACFNDGFASNGGSLEIASKMEGQKMANNRERIPRKSEIIEQQHSQKKPPRHPSPRKSDSNVDIFHKLLHETTLSSSPLDKNGQKWQPNKLSEEILRCLICIFLRLMRTSRPMELEKLNNISRSSNLISRTKSSRMVSSLNLNSRPNIHRQTVQKDPYGIFQVQGSLVRDIGPYKNLVRFASSSLELKGIFNCLPLLNKLRNLMSNLHEVNLKSLTHQQKLAFWINIHNICLMHGFLEHGLPSNPEKILGLRNKAVLNIGGNMLNALTIENFILKQPSNTKDAHWKSDKDVKEDAIRIMYGLELAEPNVQFALCFGNRSSPAVKIYTSDGVSAELEKSKLEYFQASIVVTTSRRIMIPKLLFSNMSEDLESLLEWICNQLPTSGTLRKSITDFIRGQSNGKISDIVDILPWDFEFQYLLPI
ncbi:uncharacterized protein LOC110098845 isoform X2 [Dendrobium catenatum]|uniref:uncharacterized protein LOC110098845 isoform X2 n=1 Tax=Dendrobium catenatum TaxID=906689 RepID=UPI0009F5A9C7|nr:uncharacterized protein LOC110098845 isoform X2 [Dendrobium catenatum]